MALGLTALLGKLFGYQPLVDAEGRLKTTTTATIENATIGDLLVKGSPDGGTTKVPLQTDANGQLNIKRIEQALPEGTNTIGKVEIAGVTGTGGGALPVTEKPVTAFIPRTVDASTKARLDTTPLANRRYVDISLVGAGTGYIGNADLTGSTNGIPVTEAEGYRLYADSTLPVYGIGGTFLVVEVA